MEEIEQSIIIDFEGTQQMQEISQCLKQMPALMDQNLTMISNLNFTFSIDIQEQQSNKNQERDIGDQEKRNNQLYNMRMEYYFKELNLFNQLNFYDLKYENLQSFESIQLDKLYEYTGYSQNQMKGIQNIQSNGLMSNQIFSSKFQQSLLSGPHSSRNYDSKYQSNALTSSDPQQNEQQNEKNYKGIFKHPSFVIQKTENKEKNEYPVLFKNYSQIGKNTKDASFEDQQIKQEFQNLINHNNKLKQDYQTNSTINTQNKKQKYQQKSQQNGDLQTQQKTRRPSSPKFKFVVKQKKQTKNSGQHVKLTFEKGQKVFDTSFQKLNKETSKSVDQLKINDHFLKLQNEQQRELYSKPFENIKYSEISKLFNKRTQLESPTAALYKKKVDKSKQNLSQNTINSINNKSNYSYDKDFGQEYDDSLEDDSNQIIHKVDLQQLLKERNINPHNDNLNQNFDPQERNIFSFKPQQDAQVTFQSKSQERLQNAYQQHQSQIANLPQQPHQMHLPTYTNDYDLKTRDQYQNFKNYENIQKPQSDQIQYQFQQQIQNQFPATKKQPIQIKINIQQFMNNNSLENQKFQEISQHQSKIVNQSNLQSQSLKTFKK